jgi:hypothetical protein
LSKYFESKDNYLFQINGISIDKLMKYNDGTYSSIIKGATKIEGKQGYELLNPVDIVYDIFNIVKNWFGKNLAGLFNDRIDINVNQINYLCNILEIQKYSKLKAYGTFLKEVYEEIDVATKYQKHSMITATNLQNIRIEILCIFNTNIEEIKLNLNSPEINFNKLFNDYINLKYITEYLTIALIFEYILTDRVDDISVARLLKKINDIKNAYGEVNSLIYSKANNRSNAQIENKNFMKNRWKWCFEQFIADNNIAQKIGIELNNLRNFLSKIEEDATENEVFTIVNKFVSERKKLLENIKIKPQKISEDKFAKKKYGA